MGTFGRSSCRARLTPRRRIRTPRLTLAVILYTTPDPKWQQKTNEKNSLDAKERKQHNEGANQFPLAGFTGPTPFPSVSSSGIAGGGGSPS